MKTCVPKEEQRDFIKGSLCSILTLRMGVKSPLRYVCDLKLICVALISLLMITGCANPEDLFGDPKKKNPVKVTTVTPASGPTTGSTVILISGSGFLSGAAVAIGDVPCENVNVISGQQLTCTTGPNDAGSADIVVTNITEAEGSLKNGFTYVLQPAPNILAVSPTTGPPSGGTLVTLTGSGFVEGLTVTIGGSNCTVAAFVNSSQVHCITTPNAGGSVDVILKNPDEQIAVKASGFLYQTSFALSSISPATGSPVGGTNLTINGVGFEAGSTVIIGGVACNAVSVVSSNTITCTTQAHGAGSVNVSVTHPDGRISTITGGFTYQNGPTLVSITPTSGAIGGGTTLSLIGNGFLPGASISVGGVNCNSVSVPSSTLATCTTGPHSAGAVDVTITNADGQFSTLPSAFTYRSGPTLTSISPQAGPLTGGTVVTLSGSNFIAGASVTLRGVPCSAVTVVSATQITCTTPVNTAGAVDVTVINPDSQSSTLASSYVYQAPPNVTSISPTAGSIAGGTILTLTGTGFLAGATVNMEGTGCNSVTVVSSTTMTCTTSAHAAGTLNVTVTNTDGQFSTLSSAYTYQPGPAVTSVSPAGGILTGGTLITVTGSGFGPSAAVTLDGLTCTGVVVVNSTQITCNTKDLDGMAKTV